jgi:hypothetical protein
VNLRKLFRVLVLGGAATAITHCGGSMYTEPTSAGGSSLLPDGGALPSAPGGPTGLGGGTGAGGAGGSGGSGTGGSPMGW